MTDLLNVISTLPFEKQRQLLAALAHDLTVVAREYAYELAAQDTSVNIQRLRTLNEMQHQISGSLMKAAGEYPVVDVIRNIRQTAELGGLSRQVSWVEGRVVARVLKFTGSGETPSGT